MNTPDITKSQFVGLIQAVLAVVAAFGLPITEAQSIALLGLSAAVGGLLFHSDATIRRGRASVEAERASSEAVVPVFVDDRDLIDEELVDELAKD